MQLLRLNALPKNLPPTALAIGNFDGVHLGHQAMVAQLKELAQQKNLASMVMIFEPQPLEFFKGMDAPARISSWREKVETLKELDVDYVVTAKFNEAFRSLTAQQFIDILKNQLHVQALVVGDDFKFGCDRTGDTALLQQSGFEVAQINTVLLDGARVSSTRVRQALAVGDFKQVEQLLGRPYSITGYVQHGDQIGRTLDFPTANIALNRPKPALKGIYATTVALASKQPISDYAEGGIASQAGEGLLGATHVGLRPAIPQQQPEWRLEAFLPEANGNLYGKRLKVTFWHWLHDELNYDSLASLKLGIAQDVKQIKALNSNANSSFGNSSNT